MSSVEARKPHLKKAVQIPSNDPLVGHPRNGCSNKESWFRCDVSQQPTNHPFPLLDRMSTLDHLTKGRVGWNIVTSYLPNAARNFGHEGEVPHDHPL